MSYSRPFFKDQVFEELKTECLRTGKLSAYLMALTIMLFKTFF